MKYVDFDKADRTLGAGNNPNTGDLRIGYAADKKESPGVVFLVSCWELGDEELELIQKTKRVYLSVMANPLHPTQPPVSLSVIDPYLPAEEGGYANAYTVVKDPFKFYLEYLVDKSHIKPGDTLIGEYVNEKGERYATEGELVKADDGYFVERTIGDPDRIPLMQFISIREIRPKVFNPFTEDKIAADHWTDLISRREKILLLEGPMETINEQLQAWHEEADAFVKFRPDYTQRREDLLKHE
jgi:hypothetical protein